MEEIMRSVFPKPFGKRSPRLKNAEMFTIITYFIYVNRYDLYTPVLELIGAFIHLSSTSLDGFNYGKLFAIYNDLDRNSNV